MSVHSLIIPLSTAALTVLIQSYRASWNCSIAIPNDTLCQDMLYSLLVCVYVFVCVLIMCVRVCSTSYFFPYFFMGSLSIDCAVLQKREMGPHSWSVTRSLPYSLSAWPLFFLSSTLLFITISLLLRKKATAGQIST